MKIAIITAHFPNYDSDKYRIYATEFLTQYAQAWANDGHEVNIIHLMRRYPDLFYYAAEILGKLGINSIKKYAVPRQALKENSYVYNNIVINRILFSKFVPHMAISRLAAKKVYEKVFSYLDKDIDLIIGDCFDPTLQFVNDIKNALPKAVFCQVVHNSDFAIKNNRIADGAKKIDYWLLRSKSQLPSLQAFLSVSELENYQLMYSGIENSVICNNPEYRKEIKKLLYVGALYKSKGLGTIIEALALAKNKNLTLQVIGAGEDEEYFKALVKEKNLSDRIQFIGKVKHEFVFSYMREADALVLISHETFGMVYVEAMSQACIPIGVKDDGIDGVVINNENGYLVSLGNPTELSALFNKFSELTTAFVSSISRRSYETALRLEMGELSRRMIDRFEGEK